MREPDYISKCGTVRLYCGDCLEILPTLEAGSVDAVVTSPPYAQQRQYEGSSPVRWDSIMDAFLSQPCFASHTQLLINLGLVHKNGECLTYWEPWRERMKQSGWRFFGWYVWDQGNGLPGNWAGRLAPSHEFVFHFNRESRQPNKFVRSKTGGKAKLHGSTMRGEDGKCRQKTGAGKLVAEFKIPDSVVRTYREMRRGIDHPAVYPVALASHLLAAYSNISESILDPFMGSGTTGVACVKTGRRFIGIEKEPKYFEIAKRRIEEALNATPLLAEVA